MTLKNIPIAKPLPLKEQVSCQAGQVVSKTLVQNSSVSVTLFAFDKGEELSSHESGGDAFVLCLDGRGEVQIDETRYELNAGDAIVMPARHPHAVFSKEKFKMLLPVFWSISRWSGFFVTRPLSIEKVVF